MSEPIQSFREFLRELRRRSVYKVAVAYLVAGFVVVQLADLATGAFGLPAWFEPMVWVVCGLGFPLALILAWAFEVTPEGMRRTRDEDGRLLSRQDPTADPSGDRIKADQPDRSTRSKAIATSKHRARGRIEAGPGIRPTEPRGAATSRWLADPRSWTALGVILFLVVGVVWILVVGLTQATTDFSPTVQSPVVRFRADAAPSNYSPDWGPFDISPDGSRVVFPSGEPIGGSEPLLVLNLDGSGVRILPGTEGALSPLFSPDGQWIAYTDLRRIYRVAVTGGAPQPLGEIVGGSGVLSAWDSAGAIYYSDSSGSYRVREGSEPEQLLSDGYQQARFVRPLPRRNAIAFTRHALVSNRAEIRVRDLDTGTEKTVIENGFDATYVPTGHLVYARFDRALVAVPFDLETLESRGVPIPILDSLAVTGARGFGSYSISQSGTAVYATEPPPEAASQQLRLARVDTSGTVQVLPLPAASFRDVAVSPNGRTVAYVAGAELHLFDLVTGSDRLVDSDGPFMLPVWSPDGHRVAYTGNPASLQDGAFKIFELESSDGPRMVQTDLEYFIVESWHPDGRRVLGAAGLGAASDNDLAAVNLEDGSSTPYLDAPWTENFSSFSPNGRWVAYQSLEAGLDYPTAFIRSFPVPGPQVAISDGPGAAPKWSPDGRTIYFLTEDSVHAVEFRSDPSPSVASRRTFFSRNTPEGRLAARPEFNVGPFIYDVHPDGGFVMLLRPNEEEGTPEGEDSDAESEEDRADVYVVVNWFQELRERMGDG